MSTHEERRGNAPSRTDIFKIFDETQKKSGIFSENLLTREEFARLLGINRKTMYRWEVKLIFKVSPLAIAYLNKDSPRSLYLDNFQRFVIALIFCLRNSPSYGYDTNQILRFLRLNFMQLKREQFNNWIQSFNKENTNV
ncbi:MAG: hypothetical protein KatS3mg087_0558 [Patescibacteria group bacterium]|jgi:DNA-binding XRE family transcriptional regulator|nr:MAG: hypothetical protein KatS3mg087_0558 [Patescibacteria group bacterium]